MVPRTCCERYGRKRQLATALQGGEAILTIIPLFNEKRMSSVSKKLKTLVKSSSSNCYVGK